MNEPLNTDGILSPAETRVASGYVSGMVAKEIADHIGISPYTVVRHTQNIYGKAGIGHSTNALVAWFLEKNLNLDLSEFRRRVGAAALLGLIAFQICVTDFDSDFVRLSGSRRIEASRKAGRGRRKDNTTTI